MGKPDFLIIGAQKAGTTALHEMLSQHPRLIPSTIKETHFFDNDSIYNKENYQQYHKFFKDNKPSGYSKLFFETTPIYLFHPNVAHRIF